VDPRNVIGETAQGAVTTWLTAFRA